MRIATLVAMMCVAASAFAEGSRRVDRLAVIPIVIGDEKGQVSISSVFDDISAAAAMRVGLSVISFEELDARRGITDRVRDCGSDDRCIAEKLRAFDARMGLVVVVNMALSPPLLSVNLIDTEELRVVANATGSLAASEGNVSVALRTRAQKIFDDAGYVRAARVIVEADPGRALISLGEGVEPDKGTPNVFTVTPGTYKVKASLDGFSSAEAVVDAVGGQDTRVRLALEEQVSLVESPWLWTAVGVAVAGGVTAAVLATQETTYCLCVKLKGVGCEKCQN